VPNRGSPPAMLLRESYRREGGKVKNGTLANLTRWPEDKVDALARLLKGLPPKLELVWLVCSVRVSRWPGRWRRDSRARNSRK
jgi:hypothetical protein